MSRDRRRAGPPAVAGRAAPGRRRAGTGAPPPAPAGVAPAPEPAPTGPGTHGAPPAPAEVAAAPAPGSASAGPAGTASTTLVPSPSGQGQRRRGGRRLPLLAAFVALLVLAGGGGLLASLHRRDPRPTAAGRTQRVLLLEIGAADGSVAAGALVGHDPRRRTGALLLVPSRVIAEVPGRGSAPFGRALALGGPQVAGETASDLVGVTVDGTLVLSSVGLATVVDRLGGVDATVDVDVPGPPSAGGSRPVVVPRGPQHLAGAAAVALATYLADNEPETTRLARVQSVLDGLARAAHARPGALPDVLRGLGAEVALAGFGPPEAAGVVEGYGGDSDRADTLSVRPIDTGGAAAYGVDPQGVRQQVQALFPDSQPASARAQAARVLVQNGVGTPGVGEAARRRLAAAGLRYRAGGNVPGFTFRDKPSVVLVPDAGSASVALGRRVADALGLPPTAVQVSAEGQSVADVVVVVGADFRG